jgi:hypothetical protein
MGKAIGLLLVEKSDREQSEQRDLLARRCRIKGVSN